MHYISARIAVCLETLDSDSAKIASKRLEMLLKKMKLGKLNKRNVRTNSTLATHPNLHLIVVCDVTNSLIFTTTGGQRRNIKRPRKVSRRQRRVTMISLPIPQNQPFLFVFDFPFPAPPSSASTILIVSSSTNRSRSIVSAQFCTSPISFSFSRLSSAIF